MLQALGWVELLNKLAGRVNEFLNMCRIHVEGPKWLLAALRFYVSRDKCLQNSLQAEQIVWNECRRQLTAELESRAEPLTQTKENFKDYIFYISFYILR